MKNSFIIDENVLLNARRGINDEGKIASSERIFLYGFFESDNKLPHTPNIRKKYYKISKAVLKDNKYQDIGIMKWFFQRLINSDLCPMVEGLKIPNYRFIKSGDDEFVCLAIFCNGNLVSVDRRLKEEIEKEGLDDKVKYVYVKDAISLLN